MSIKVNTQPKNRVSINIPQHADIRSVGVTNKAATAVEYLRSLKDVNSANLTDNDTVVYDSASDKFIIRELPIVNGGNF